MATNPLGPDKTNLTVNMPKSMKAALAKLAERSNMRLGEYCRSVLEKAIEEDVEFERYLLKKAAPPRQYKVAEDGPQKRESNG